MCVIKRTKSALKWRQQQTELNVTLSEGIWFNTVVRCMNVQWASLGNDLQFACSVRGIVAFGWYSIWHYFSVFKQFQLFLLQSHNQQNLTDKIINIQREFPIGYFSACALKHPFPFFFFLFFLPFTESKALIRLQKLDFGESSILQQEIKTYGKLSFFMHFCYIYC